MKNITAKIGITAFAFALILGASVSSAYAFDADKDSRPSRAERPEGHEGNGRKGSHKGGGSEESQAFRAEQRAELQEFIGLDHNELKALHEDGENMADILDGQNIEENDMEDFLNDQIEELMSFMIDERDLDDDQIEKIESQLYSRVEHKLDRWYN